MSKKKKKKKLVGEADYEKVGSGFAQPKSSLFALKEFLERNSSRQRGPCFQQAVLYIKVHSNVQCQRVSNTPFCYVFCLRSQLGVGPVINRFLGFEPRALP